MTDIGTLSFVGTFLLGIIIGAAGEFFSNFLTDRRREHEAKSNEKKQFLEVANQMPDLISEMKNDLSKQENKLVREFFIAKKTWSITFGDEVRFIYYEEEHPRLRSKISVLHNLGYITEIRSGDLPIYRMTEGFVRLILTYG